MALGEPGYEEAREIWNAMVDRRPAAIARCVSAEGVVQCVRFAREHEVLVAVRGGGHNIAGNALCDGGLVIDLSPMKRVEVDARARRATVEPGCTLGDFDAASQAHGLATPPGINSTTGVAGLTLGGWLAESEVRHGGGQPAFGRGGNGRKATGAGQRAGEPGPVLGGCGVGAATSGWSPASSSSFIPWGRRC